MTHADIIREHRAGEADCEEPNIRSQALDVAARILPPNASDSQLKLAAACYLRGQADAYAEALRGANKLTVEFPIGRFVP